MAKEAGTTVDRKHQSARASAAENLLARVTTEDVFQALTAEAARRLGVTYTQISIVTDQAVVGAGQTPVERGTAVDLDQSVCSNVVRTDDMIVSDDLRLDPRLASIDAVINGHVRSYAGVPIRLAPEGHIVGVFCAFDPAERHWTPEEIGVLEEFAARTIDAIQNPS